MDDSQVIHHIEAVRAFNRFYTRKLGVLDEQLLDNPYSITEARLLYEIATRRDISASELGEVLGLDRGYLSRLLARLELHGLVTKLRSERDARRQHLALTETGQAAFERLAVLTRQQIGTWLDALDPPAREALIDAMRSIRGLLDEAAPQPPAVAPRAYLLRDLRPGDLGWIVHRHGVLYAQELGWDERFEGFVAGILADYMRQHDPAWERAWIADSDGKILGAVFLMKGSEEVGKLRVLYVEPEARGLGIGSRLVKECIAHARQVGYRELRLWTDDRLVAARRIYQAVGFQLVEETREESWGKPWTSQVWALQLTS